MNQPRRNLPRWAVWLGLLLVFFGGMAPTLAWMEFSGGMENLNIATALELRRDHQNWLIPTLEGERRLKKPPLTAWITAAAIRSSTIDALSSADPALRHAAADHLAWETRWPSLLAACLMLIATYELGRVIADPVTGLVAAIIAGTNLLFFRFAASATTDVHLGLWVTVANVALAHAILKGRRWRGLLIAGIALGLGFLAKGPVAWVETLVPVIVYGGFCVAQRQIEKRRLEVRGFPMDAPTSSLPPYAPPAPTSPNGNWLTWIAPAIAGILLMLAVALPWFIYIYRTVPGGMSIWLGEVTTERGEKPSSWYQYTFILPYFLPWTIAFIGGIINARRAMILAVFLALMPLLVMSFYKDRKERYMYPITSAAAVVAAGGIMTLARKREMWNALDRAAVAQHWGLLVVAGVVVPAVAATLWTPWFRTITGEPWLTRASGAGLTIALGLTIAIGMSLRRNWLASMVATTIIVTLVIHAAMLPGYAKTEQGESPMRPLAEAIWKDYPDAQMFNAHPRGKRASVDLSIYLNRITEWVSKDELSQIRPVNRPQIVVMLQDAKDPDEPKPPAGWKKVFKVQRDKDWWWAFVLEPAK